MGENLFTKILNNHQLSYIVDEIPIYPDQVLTQDATGTVVFLQLEAMGVKKVKPFSVMYIDHNTLQVGYKNHDDHKYIQSLAKKIGVYVSKAGNGICHSVHLETYSKPGQIVIGSDSHTPTAGGVGMLGIGAGGLDVAVAMAGEPYYLSKPQVIGINLEGELSPWVSAKDIILYILKLLTVKGGRGKIFEYFGDGIKNLSVYDRATICNLGAEMGATSSLFPSDEITLDFLKSVGREDDWVPLKADQDAKYDEVINVNMSAIEPLIALPHSPDNVVKVSEVEGTPLSQVAIGSCTNSSMKDMAVVAAILNGKTVAHELDLIITPGTRRVLSMMAETGDLKSLIDAGARILEVTCGPCNGVGQSPASGSNSLRTYNRNYKGRSGTADAKVFLASAETAAVSALTGYITDPRSLGNYPEIKLPKFYPVNKNMIIEPDDTGDAKVIKGPNIKPIPTSKPIKDFLEGTVELKTKDNISTDDILPGGANMLALRSNIPASVPYVFSRIDSEFNKRVDKLPTDWFVVGGENFGQGSSREHAVMVPMSIGMRAVIVKSFARIYRQNLINYGVIPLTFAQEKDYDRIQTHDILVIEDLSAQLKNKEIKVYNKTQDFYFLTKCNLTSREQEILLSGGLVNYTKEKLKAVM